MTDKIFALTIYIDYNGPNVYPKRIRIVFDYSWDDSSSETQGQSVWSGEKTGRKFSSTGERAPWLLTLTELFPTIQADAGSWLGS